MLQPVGIRAVSIRFKAKIKRIFETRLETLMRKGEVDWATAEKLDAAAVSHAIAAALPVPLDTKQRLLEAPDAAARLAAEAELLREV